MFSLPRIPSLQPIHTLQASSDRSAVLAAAYQAKMDTLDPKILGAAIGAIVLIVALVLANSKPS